MTDTNKLSQAATKADIERLEKWLTEVDRVLEDLAPKEAKAEAKAEEPVVKTGQVTLHPVKPPDCGCCR